MNPTDALGPELQPQPSGPCLEDALREHLDAAGAEALLPRGSQLARAVVSRRE